MKNITNMRKISLSALLIFTGAVTSAQTDDQQGEDKVIIRKIEIINGDTTTEEKILSGEEARAYRHRHGHLRHNGPGEEHMKAMEERLKDRMEHMEERRTITDRKREHAGHNGKGRSHGNDHYSKKIVIIQNSDGEDEVIEKSFDVSVSGEDKTRNIVIRKETDDEGEEISKIEILDEKIIITDSKGEERTIELSVPGSPEGNRSTKRMIIVKEMKTGENGEEEKTTDKSVTTVKSEEGKMEVSFYPNPSNGTFTMESHLEKGKTTITIMDNHGKKVYEDTLEGGIQKKQIDLRDQGKGIYLVTLEQKGKILSTKVVVE